MRINAVGQLIVFLPPDILEMVRIRKVWMVMEGHQSSMMMPMMMIRMAIVTKWDANEGVNTMDKGCGCAAKTCFDDSDHLPASLPVTLIAYPARAHGDHHHHHRRPHHHWVWSGTWLRRLIESPLCDANTQKPLC